MAIYLANFFLVLAEISKWQKIDESEKALKGGTYFTHFVSLTLYLGLLLTFAPPRKHKKTATTAMSIGLVIHSAILLTALLCLAFNGEIPVWIPVPSWHSTDKIVDFIKLKLDQKTNVAFHIYTGLFCLVVIDVILLKIVFEKDEPTLPQHMTPSLLESERSIQDGIPMIVEQPQGLPSEATSAPAGDCS
jgi:formate-dependent nitrite reductase membrane component NrfD